MSTFYFKTEDDCRLHLADLLTQIVTDEQLTIVSRETPSADVLDWMASGGKLSLHFTPAHFQHAAFRVQSPFERFNRGLLTLGEMVFGTLEAASNLLHAKQQREREFDEQDGDLEDAELICEFVSGTFLDDTEVGVRPFDLQSEAGVERFLKRCRCVAALLGAFSSRHYSYAAAERREQLADLLDQIADGGEIVLIDTASQPLCVVEVRRRVTTGGAVHARRLSTQDRQSLDKIAELIDAWRSDQGRGDDLKSELTKLAEPLSSVDPRWRTELLGQLDQLRIAANLPDHSIAPNDSAHRESVFATTIDAIERLLHTPLLPPFKQ